ncbi:MAG: MFS transporter, partial [Kiritimatiellia bacterium]
MTQWKKTFICLFFAQVLSIVGFSFSIPFLPFFINELGITDQAQQAWWAGITLAATGITLAIFAPIWGVLADRYGRKKMVLRSMIGGTLVLLLMSYSRNIT